MAHLLVVALALAPLCRRRSAAPDTTQPACRTHTIPACGAHRPKPAKPSTPGKLHKIGGRCGKHAPFPAAARCLRPNCGLLRQVAVAYPGASLLRPPRDRRRKLPPSKMCLARGSWHISLERVCIALGCSAEPLLKARLPIAVPFTQILACTRCCCCSSSGCVQESREIAKCSQAGGECSFAAQQWHAGTRDERCTFT